MLKTLRIGELVECRTVGWFRLEGTTWAIQITSHSLQLIDMHPGDITQSIPKTTLYLWMVGLSITLTLVDWKEHLRGESFITNLGSMNFLHPLQSMHFRYFFETDVRIIGSHWTRQLFHPFWLDIQKFLWFWRIQDNFSLSSNWNSKSSTGSEQEGAISASDWNSCSRHRQVLLIVWWIH